MKVLLGGVAFAIALALAPIADARSPGGGPQNTFTGHCHYDGFIEFRDPIGVLPEPNGLVFAVRGPCTGWLDGRRVENEPASFYDASEGLMSCTQGLPSGPGVMLIGGASIPFVFNEVRSGPGSKFNFTGEDGGTLEGVGSTDDELPFLIDRCLTDGGSLKRVSVFANVAGSISG